MKPIASMGKILNLQTLIVTALAVLSTYFCRSRGYEANFPLTIIGIAVVFPVVFSISGAYKRREAALNHYGSLKGNGRAIYLAVRDWLDETDEGLLVRTRDGLSGLLATCRDMLASPVESSDETEVLEAFSRISLIIKDLRKKGMAFGELSRVNQYLEKMLISFERLKHIYQYRTPRTLRAYSKLFIFLLPPLYGPYFAHIGRDLMPVFSYVMPAIFSVVLVSLDNIQDHLENPFDQVGEDDILINAEKFGESLWQERKG
jgi:predicted membrane chloride channel (bestrophin family)